MSPLGNDINVGSEKFLFATLEKAKITIRKSKGKINTVFLREGTYTLLSSFTLTGLDSVLSHLD